MLSPQKRMGGKLLCQKTSFQMNRKAGENSRCEQTRKPLGQKEKTVGKLGGDVWDLGFILGILLVRMVVTEEQAGPGAGIYFWALHWGKSQKISSEQAPSCDVTPQLPLHASAFQQMKWKMRQNGNWDCCYTMRTQAPVVCLLLFLDLVWGRTGLSCLH